MVLQQRPDTLTTGAGHPIGDKLNLQTAGPRGPLVVQDVVFTDEMAHFDRERIPERVVHAKGAGEYSGCSAQLWPLSRTMVLLQHIVSHNLEIPIFRITKMTLLVLPCPSVNSEYVLLHDMLK